MARIINIPAEPVLARMWKAVDSRASQELQAYLLDMWERQGRAITGEEIQEAYSTGETPYQWSIRWQEDYEKFIEDQWFPFMIKGIKDVAKYLKQYDLESVMLKYKLQALDPREEFILNWVNNEGGKLITQLSDTQKRAVNQTLVWGLDNNIPPTQMSKHIRPNIGLTLPQQNAVNNYYNSLRDAGFSSTQANTYSSSYASNLHRQRAMNIARTEAATAYNQGQLRMVKEMNLPGSPLAGAEITKTWHDSGLPKRVGPICEDINGETVPLNSLFSVGVDAPPLHPLCMCTLSYHAEVRPQRGLSYVFEKQAA